MDRTVLYATGTKKEPDDPRTNGLKKLLCEKDIGLIVLESLKEETLPSGTELIILGLPDHIGDVY